MTDPKTKVKSKEKSLTTSSKDNSQTEMKFEKLQSKEDRHVEFDSNLEISPDSTINTNYISSANPVANVEKVTENTMSEPTIEVEVMEPRRSARNRKQTKLFGNPLLYRITYQLTPRLIPELLQHLSDTMETLKEKYGNTVEF